MARAKKSLRQLSQETVLTLRLFGELFEKLGLVDALVLSWDPISLSSSYTSDLFYFVWPTIWFRRLDVELPIMCCCSLDDLSDTWPTDKAMSQTRMTVEIRSQDRLGVVEVDRIELLDPDLTTKLIDIDIPLTDIDPTSLTVRRIDTKLDR
jgi:hypothetical protein